MKKVIVYDYSLELVGVLYTWISMAWNTSYNGSGGFTLEVQQDSEAARILQPWNFCTIDRTGDAMVITSVEVKDRKIVANGFPAVYLLKNRSYNQKVSNTNAEQAMLDAVDSITDFPEIVVAEPKGFQDHYSGETKIGSVYDCIFEIAQATDIGFRLRLIDGALVFDCYKPELNENAVFTERFGNLGDISYTISGVDAYNVAVVAGANATVIVGDSGSTGIHRRELLVDKTSVEQEEEETYAEYVARLTQFGVQALAEKKESEQISFTVAADDVELGDVVTVILNELALSLEVRLVEKLITSQKNRTTTEYTVGTPILARRL